MNALRVNNRLKVNRNFLKLTGCIAVGMLLGGAIMSGQSAAAIQWGGTGHVTTDQWFDLPGNPVDSANGIRTWNSLNSAFVSSSGGAYSGPAIYGMLQSQVPGYEEIRARISNVGAGDRIQLEGSNVEGITREISGLLYFKKEDFLNGLDQSAGLAFAADGTLSMNILTLPGSDGGPRQVRFAVQNGNQWYVAQSFLGGNALYTLNDLPDTLWAAWDPDAAPLNARPSAGDYTILGSTFEDIQAIGYYFVSSRTSGTQRPTVTVDAFSASLQSIPEPGTYALIILAGMLVLRHASSRKPKQV